MKKLSQLISEAKQKLDFQEDTINYIPANDLKTYLKVADKFISDETKELVQYLIVNNANYIQEMTASKDSSGNALADFYDNGPYREPHKKEVYALVGKIVKSNRILEIPVFQTPEQFNGIITGEISPDTVIMDLTSEQGRNFLVKKYEKLIYKIALSFNGKTNIPFEDILSAGYEGFTNAMNSYGKKSKKAINKESETGEELDISQYKQTTFMTYASYAIRFAILDSIKSDAHLVRIPNNKQAEERKEKGHNTKNTSVSGDKVIGGEEKGKTLFDYVGGMEDAAQDINNDDIVKTWKELLNLIKSSGKFSDKMINAWMQFNQLDGKEKRKNKDIAKELGICNSNVTYYCMAITNFIKKDPKARALAKDLLDLYNENLQLSYDNDNEEPVYFTVGENKNTSEE